LPAAPPARHPQWVKPQEPWFFLKTTAASIIGTEAPIHLPSFSRQVDWEAELGVVIGRAARDLPESRAFEAVAGLCHCQRLVGTRSDETRGHDVCLRLSRPEVLSRCGPHGPLADTSCLCGRSAPNGRQAMGQRSAQTGFEYQPHGAWHRLRSVSIPGPPPTCGQHRHPHHRRFPLDDRRR
jgi:Fumarylacetoacetate (FAA) hydrolase family